ncbi:hypothetical protein EXN66_Car014196 [Channa argus]|uniref:Uncharacterized protein n=1 Tax=Channa argus TaxID=215402 RepID=A0A6G1Q7I4_CHAAH|nr:hypothetical protein EXN66_Car014196 [Channa argus]
MRPEFEDETKADVNEKRLLCESQCSHVRQEKGGFYIQANKDTFCPSVFNVCVIIHFLRWIHQC